MIFPSVDIMTMQLMLAVTHFVFFILFIQFTRQNKDIKGLRWWLYASILLTVEINTPLFPGFRNLPAISYLLNFSGLLAYIFLMIGCIRFSSFQINQKIIYGLIAIAGLYALSGMIFNYDVIFKIYFIGVFISVTLAISIIATLNLKLNFYAVEKYILIFLLTAHILIYASWGFVSLGLENGINSYFSFSLVSIYIIDAMIFTNIFLLILARKREELNEENDYYKYTQKEMAAAISNANNATSSKSSFLENLSQSLKNPLTEIITTTSVVGKDISDPLNDKQRELNRTHFTII